MAKQREPSQADANLSGDYARDAHYEGYGDDYARESHQPGTAARGDLYVRTDDSAVEDVETPGASTKRGEHIGKASE